MKRKYFIFNQSNSKHFLLIFHFVSYLINSKCIKRFNAKGPGFITSIPNTLCFNNIYFELLEPLCVWPWNHPTISFLEYNLFKCSLPVATVLGYWDLSRVVSLNAGPMWVINKTWFVFLLLSFKISDFYQDSPNYLSFLNGYPDQISSPFTYPGSEPPNPTKSKPSLILILLLCIL